MAQAPRAQPGATLVLDDALVGLGKLDEASVDLVFADPPYNLSNDGFTCASGRAVSVNKGEWDRSAGVEEDFAFHREWIAACRRVLKPGGTLWVSGTYHSIYACGYALALEGFHLLNDIAWLKPNASPNLSCRTFTASHETLLWARRDRRAKHTFNYDAMRDGDHPEDRLKAPGKQMRSVWSIPTPPKREKAHGRHPTQKPLALLERIVTAASNPGDLVVDPFMGSGTTGLAALALGREFFGVELDPDHFALARARLEAAEAGPVVVVG